MVPTVIKPDLRESKTTIQIDKDTKEALAKIGSKGESYNKIIARLVSEFRANHNVPECPATQIEVKPTSGPINISGDITISRYEKVTISINDKIYPQKPYYNSPVVTLEVSYNKPIKKEDLLYQIDLKIDRVIFDNEVYSLKEFFGVLQKDMVYCEEFVYYYLKSIMEIIKIEFKKSNYFFKSYEEYLELSRWRTFLLNSKLSPEILSSDVESVLADLKNEKTNKQLIKDVESSYYHKIREFGVKSPWG